MLELEETFAPNLEVRRVKAARDLLSAADPSTATVAFSSRIARWIKERYPAAKYGAEAEVVEPEGMRELVRRMLS